MVLELERGVLSYFFQNIQNKILLILFLCFLFLYFWHPKNICGPAIGAFDDTKIIQFG
jgi:hypothetical protein